ncbi:hypothetical protein CY34DRAFT_562489 [Suillus luteus UH-Slu-Lm8-n1]|uniref:Uncharacterized protein n=1 Tax=Suillus luteus UH-Slu-Lm8-n1 TaxID=930992 RepID=A0A0D0AN42_9AGAM|nr:hypothetical protein CY34DRAFT_562489 [Suillus luteus UH-Slu-Lm8-n1]
MRLLCSNPRPLQCPHTLGKEMRRAEWGGRERESGHPSSASSRSEIMKYTGGMEDEAWLTNTEELDTIDRKRSTSEENEPNDQKVRLMDTLGAPLWGCVSRSARFGRGLIMSTVLAVVCPFFPDLPSAPPTPYIFFPPAARPL